MEEKILKYQLKIDKIKKKMEKDVARRRPRTRSRSRSPLTTRVGGRDADEDEWLEFETTRMKKVPENDAVLKDIAAPDASAATDDNAAPDASAATDDNAAPEDTTEEDDETTPANPLLLALGLNEITPNKWGPNILAELATKWSDILKNGLKKEEKEIVLKTYMVPENCQLLSPPQINGEVKAAINEACKNRDKNLENKQKEIGLALTALGLAITELLTDAPDNIKVMKLLSDTGRIMTDLHHGENITRKTLIAPLLDKNFTKMTEEVKRDEYLFGVNLSDRIKDKITIEKSSQQIKRVQPPPTKPAPRQGNWNGPPRAYAQSKGMSRGGLRRPAPAPPTSQQKKAAPTTSRRPQAHRQERTYQRARGRR